MTMNESTPSKIEYGSISKEIEDMYIRDQDMRRRALENNGVIETDEDEVLDQKNTARMKEIVNQIGWPTVSKVGREVSEMAWLLVQHADHDVEFQKRCLQLMREQPEEVSISDIAYLEDRICVNEGNPQIYGTQFYGEGTNYGPRPIKDPENVNERRKKLGMESLEEYREYLKEKYRDGK